MRKELTANNRPSGWFHIALVVEGNRDMEVYNNKVARTESVITNHRTSNDPFIPGSGVTIIGKKYTDRDNSYSSVVVDEVAMWNRALSETEVAQIYDMDSI